MGGPEMDVMIRPVLADYKKHEHHIWTPYRKHPAPYGLGDNIAAYMFYGLWQFAIDVYSDRFMACHGVHCGDGHEPMRCWKYLHFVHGALKAYADIQAHLCKPELGCPTDVHDPKFFHDDWMVRQWMHGVVELSPWLWD